MEGSAEHTLSVNCSFWNSAKPSALAGALRNMATGPKPQSVSSNNMHPKRKCFNRFRARSGRFLTPPETSDSRCEVVAFTLRVCHVHAADLSLSRCGFTLHAAKLSCSHCGLVTFTLRICHFHAARLSRSRCGVVTFTLRICHVHAANLSLPERETQELTHGNG